MSANASSPVDIRRAGLEALSTALGPVGMARFLRQFETGSGNYSATRYEVLGVEGVDALAELIRRRRASRGE